MKKWYKTSICENILITIFVIVVLIIIFGGAYLIANSNLPDWFKFFLLK